MTHRAREHRDAPRWASRLAALGAAACLGLAACSRPAPPPPPPLFYPPPPAEPRIQFLRTLATSDDVVPRPSSFELFVLGESRKREVELLGRPYGLAFWKGKLYVCDSGARRGVIFDFGRRKFLTFGQEGAYRFGLPVNVSVGPEGEKYVTDTVRGEIVVLGPDDQPVRALSGPPGMKPCDALWHDGELYVADLHSNSILCLDPASGRQLRQFGGTGSEPGQFFQPTNLAFGPDGHLYVTDTLNARVQELDTAGRVVRIIGSRGRRLGQMVRPKGIAVDREDRLYVCDAAEEVVQVFDGEGRLLMALGQPGAGRGDLSLPAKVAISYDGLEYFAKDAAPGFHLDYLIFVTSQLGPNRINVYGFGTRKGPPAGTGQGAQPLSGLVPRTAAKIKRD